MTHRLGTWANPPGLPSSAAAAVQPQSSRSPARAAPLTHFLCKEAETSPGLSPVRTLPGYPQVSLTR